MLNIEYRIDVGIVGIGTLLLSNEKQPLTIQYLAAIDVYVEILFASCMECSSQTIKINNWYFC
jgi:hypothetical protein